MTFPVVRSVSGAVLSLGLAIGTIGWAAVAAGGPPFPIAGFNINLYGRGQVKGAPSLANSIDQLAATGSNIVLVTTPYFQTARTSNEVVADAAVTETDDALVVLFGMLQARGLNVAYKFTLIPQDGTWSGDVQPSNPAAWFASYQAHLVRLAALCEAQGVKLLYIANEMQSMASPVYGPQWNAVVDAVRTVYSGQLSWNAVLGRSANSEAFNIPVASRLDHIGLSAYEPLTDKMNPTVDELVAAWYGNRLGISLVGMAKTLHAVIGKPIVFSELSYRSVDGNNIDPASWQAQPGDVLDPQEQADCYEAFMRVWTAEKQSCMLGVFWWQWQIAPEYGLPHSQSPQNLPAQAVVTRWFGGTPRISADVGVNQSSFVAGDTLQAKAALTDPGLGGAADVYLGALRPDGKIEFVTAPSGTIALVAATDVASFRPIATVVPLAAGFAVAVTNAYVHRWAGTEPHGDWVFFLAVLKAGALAGGTITGDAILGLAASTFSFPLPDGPKIVNSGFEVAQ